MAVFTFSAHKRSLNVQNQRKVYIMRKAAPQAFFVQIVELN